MSTKYDRYRNLRFRVPHGYYALFHEGDVVTFDEIEDDIYASLQDLRCFEEWLDKRIEGWEIVHETDDFLYVKKEEPCA